ncbi:MAG: putative Ig domain-containing protein [Acidobacteriaceae bacterium]
MRTVKAIGIGAGILAIVSLLGCGSAVVESILTPTIKAVLPQSITAGTRVATVEVSGTNFTPSAVILWNGAQLSTSQVNSGTLSASVEGSSIAVPGTAQVQVRDVTTGRSSQMVPVSIVSATTNATLPLAISSTSLSAGVEGSSYNAALAATGGTSPYTWSVIAGSLPAGLHLAAGSGVISGVPTVSGNFAFTVSVSDSSSPIQTQTAAVSIAVTVAPLSVPPLAITTTTLAAGASGTAYTQTLMASGGTSPYVWTVSSGSLPAGLTLSSGGVISGTPTASGTSSFTISVHDSSSPEQTRTATLSITVAPPALTITSTTLVTGTTNTSYTATLKASGGTAPYTWKVSSGSLPAGLALSASSGVVSGTPTGDGASSFTVTVTDSSSPAQTKSATISITIDPTPPPGTTWFIRPDGGTRYSSNVPTGQCNGMYDQPYPGNGVNQNCAFNDVRYLWSDNAGDPNAWVISGGDTVVIRGCTALSSQMNPDNPNCRLGYDNNNNGNPPNSWCGYGNPNISCFNPPIPAGTAERPTRILGQCAYGTYTCTPINNDYPYGKTNETQLYGGFGLIQTFNLTSTSYVEIEGIELTTHNGKCTIGVGTPAYPAPCSNNVPYSDYAQNGFLTDNTTSNITFQDVYIHGFDSAAFFGPIGGPITMTRVFAGFNALAGWMFDDGNATPDAPGSSITANYVTMIFNGCYEQYPITAKYPAQVCYDSNSMGFGDSWSGQGSGSGGQSSELSSFYCNHCVDDYNTKDGFIGPHISIPQLTIINSVAIGNMGSNWKWGGTDGIVNTTTFQNNLTVNNCSRMSQPMDGVPSTYNMYLSNFCRAGGSGMASVIPIGSTWNLQNNTFISADTIALYVACSGADTNCPATINSTNNVFLGYQDPWGSSDSRTPSVYYFSAGGNGDEPETGITLNVSHNIEYGMTSGSCTGESYPGTSTGVLCEDPLLVNEPAQPWPGGEADLDVFNPFAANNSFYPLPNSQIIGAGVAISGLTDDYYGVPYTNPPNMGGVASSEGEAVEP